MDPTEEDIILPDLNIKIDTTKFTIILVGRNPVSNQKFHGKFEPVQFPCLNLKKRGSIAEKYYKDLGESDASDPVVQEIIKQDPYCGTSSLRNVLDKYVDKKRDGRGGSFDVKKAFDNQQDELREVSASKKFLGLF
jgi:hypothetical protein